MTLPELRDGLHAVPPGKIASVVTSLEMLEPSLKPADLEPGSVLVRIEQPDLDWYRAMFRRIGERWLWFSRLTLDDAALAAIIRDPAVEVYSAVRDGTDMGLVELDFRVPGECELAFLGLLPMWVGQGLGRRIMGEATARAWSRPIRRFWVHTCSLDHPDALRFYRRGGFVPFRRAVEIADDPRAKGQLPRSAAPDVPIL